MKGGRKSWLLTTKLPLGKKNCLWGQHWKRNLGFEGGFPGGFGHHFCRCSCYWGYLLNANIKIEKKETKQKVSIYTHIHCKLRYLSVTLTTVLFPDSSLPFCATTMINLLLHEKSRLFCEHLCRSLISSRLALTHCIVLQWRQVLVLLLKNPLVLQGITKLFSFSDEFFIRKQVTI